MATLRAFRALRPRPDLAAEVASVPYDVVTSTEARRLAAGKPHSFLRVVRPEIDLPEDVDEHDERVYRKGAENLGAFVSDGVMLQDDEPALYVYRLVLADQAQAGLFGCVSVAEYDEEVILKHERTRPDKEDDRTRHILEQRAHAEPVMLTYRDDSEVARLTEDVQRGEPLYDFVAEDGVQHTIWRIADSGPVATAFQRTDRIYVADGHHRCKAASRAAHVLAQNGARVDASESSFFPAVLFPMSQVRILPYNRVIRRVPQGVDRLLSELAERTEVSTNVPDRAPSLPGTVCLYARGQWHRVRLPDTRRATIVAHLDVARLGEHVLEPLLHISDPRTDKNIDFVGGGRGESELERIVDEGEAELAISIYPTSVDELVEVSDAGQLMPPKSTWFEPKLRSGLLVHRF